MLRRTQRFTLFPYTTLFRSGDDAGALVFGWQKAVAPERRPDHDLGAGPKHDVAGQILVFTTKAIQAPRPDRGPDRLHVPGVQDRKSTRLNSSHANISYAVFC